MRCSPTTLMPRLSSFGGHRPILSDHFYILFEILPAPPLIVESLVFCGTQRQVFVSLSPRPYTVDDVLEWCMGNDCTVDSYDNLHVIHPTDDDAAFSFRLRWL